MSHAYTVLLPKLYPQPIDYILCISNSFCYLSVKFQEDLQTTEMLTYFIEQGMKYADGQF